MIFLRYLRLYLYCVQFSVSRALEFRLDFWFRIVMDIFYYLMNIVFFKIIFLQVRNLGGWQEPEAMVFVAGYLVLDAINMTVFSSNIWMLPELINKGDLDYYLVRPVSAFFLVNFRDFSLGSFVNFLMSLGILTWALISYPHPIHVGNVIVFFVLIALGALLYHLVHFLFVVPVFWTHSARGFGQMFFTFVRFAERPDRIFSGIVRVVLMTAVPFCVMAAVPAHYFIEDGNSWAALHVVLVTIVFLFLSLGIWRLGLKSYSSASS